MAYFIKTLDKRETVATLRQWRKESTNKIEVDLINDMIHLIESGELDG